MSRSNRRNGIDTRVSVVPGQSSSVTGLTTGNRARNALVSLFNGTPAAVNKKLVRVAFVVTDYVLRHGEYPEKPDLACSDAFTPALAKRVTCEQSNRLSGVGSGYPGYIWTKGQKFATPPTILGCAPWFQEYYDELCSEYWLQAYLEDVQKVIDESKAAPVSDDVKVAAARVDVIDDSKAAGDVKVAAADACTQTEGCLCAGLAADTVEPVPDEVRQVLQAPRDFGHVWRSERNVTNFKGIYFNEAFKRYVGIDGNPPIGEQQYRYGTDMAEMTFGARAAKNKHKFVLSCSLDTIGKVALCFNAGGFRCEPDVSNEGVERSLQLLCHNKNFYDVRRLMNKITEARLGGSVTIKYLIPHDFPPLDPAPPLPAGVDTAGPPPSEGDCGGEGMRCLPCDAMGVVCVQMGDCE